MASRGSRSHPGPIFTLIRLKPRWLRLITWSTRAATGSVRPTTAPMGTDRPSTPSTWASVRHSTRRWKSATAISRAANERGAVGAARRTASSREGRASRPPSAAARSVSTGISERSSVVHERSASSRSYVVSASAAPSPQPSTGRPSTWPRRRTTTTGRLRWTPWAVSTGRAKPNSTSHRSTASRVAWPLDPMSAQARSRLPALWSLLVESSPVGSLPVGSLPVGSLPARWFPVRSLPTVGAYGAAKRAPGASLPVVGSTSGFAGRTIGCGFHRPGWRNGRRDGLKIHCPKGRAGSNPAPGTAMFEHLCRSATYGHVMKCIEVLC